MSRALHLMAATVLAGTAVLTAAGPARAADESPEVIAVDLLLAGDWTTAAREAMRIWNDAVPAIKFVEQATEAPLRVKAYTTATGTSSHVYISGAGQGWVYLENGDAQRYQPTRIVAHELGHMLSLNDIGSTDQSCAKLMSGATAGPDCRDDHPDAAEIAEVTAFFEQNDVGDPVPWFHG
ncbi:snapalysin family zinc-dependent metalloprotease [Actinoplanes sp. N902-109]|uniref:snapalysin family zinc-dependent metalloprotease n=1 Tax=Actinoplanes sp. (strain N902-109) TaxID=649831 RepID=UPI00032948B4|nr:snapalysin family zinc-dependent metalloprotease [Actinoplanes sp. N902-109]AGL16804.1 putative secreted extracellular small neutral protease [Actinoplanes sp. N902-109]